MHFLTYTFPSRGVAREPWIKLDARLLLSLNLNFENVKVPSTMVKLLSEVVNNVPKHCVYTFGKNFCMKNEVFRCFLSLIVSRLAADLQKVNKVVRVWKIWS